MEEERSMENKVFEEEIDLMWLMKALVRKLWLILSVAVVVASVVAGYTYFGIQPTYTSTSKMLVLAKETTLTSLTDLQLGSQLTKDYTVLITSRPVLEKVIENLQLDMSYKKLRERITIDNPEDTRILNISVTLTDAEMAKVVVDELSEVSSAYIADKMEVAAPKVIEEGEVTGTRTGPNMIKNIIIGFLVGAFLVCAVIIVLELMNDAIQTEDDIERYLGIPTLAIVPKKASEQKESQKERRNKKWHTKA